MALVFCDGFEQYSTVSGLNVATSTDTYTYSRGSSYGWCAYSATTGTLITNNTVFRTTQTGSSKSLSVASNSFICKIPNPSTLIVGFGLRVTSLAANKNIITFSDSLDHILATRGLRVRVLTTGVIDFYNDLTNASIAASVASTIAINTWYYVELKINFGLVGSVEIKIDESSVCSAGVIDSLCGCTTVQFAHFMNSTANLVYFDDLYMCDSSGSTNNDYLGAIKVYTLFPTANGSTNNFSVTNAASNYLAVNTSTPDLTSYISNATSGEKDLYAVEDLPVSPTTIYGTQVNVRAIYPNSSASFSQQLGIRTSGTELFGSNKKTSVGSWNNMTEVFEKQADGTTAWDTTAVNAMEAGIKNT